MDATVLFLANKIGNLAKHDDSGLTGDELRKPVFKTISKKTGIPVERIWAVWNGEKFADDELAKIEEVFKGDTAARDKLSQLTSVEREEFIRQLTEAIEKVDGFSDRNPGSRLNSPKGKAELTTDVFRAIRVRDDMGTTAFSLALDVLDEKI